jgi:hypothetical protein
MDPHYEVWIIDASRERFAPSHSAQHSKGTSDAD